jgi:two-component system sensor histidine kinase CiaH
MQAMFRSAVFKLTAAYVAIVMAICIIFSGVLYHLAINELHTGIYNQYSRWLDAYKTFGLHTPGSPSEELTSRSQHILTELVYLNLFVLVITSVACNILAKRTLRPIEAAHEQQKRFTADVSHELRTPLTALKMETEVMLLDKKASSKALRTTLQSNLEEVEHMETLINNLLLLSSMEAHKLRTVFRKLDIQTLVNDATGTVSTLASAKKIRLVSKLEPVYTKGEPTTLTQLIVILLENAIKYSPEKSTVTITLNKGKGRAVIDIQDKGKGIPAAALPHVFDRFYRADSARGSIQADGKPTKGYGLGLSLAKLIADLHDGEIIISSTEGSGTQASVILPL